jgi:hypothetical protein
LENRRVMVVPLSDHGKSEATLRVSLLSNI